jgi:polyisoprenoid-binding protein YceI
MSRIRSLLALSTLSLVACVNTAPTNRPDPLLSSADRVWFEGTSNIRQFTCNAKKVYVSTEAAPENFQRTKVDGVPAVRNAAVDVPVKSLDCGIGLQNAHLFETLGASAHPDITFVLNTYAVQPSQDKRNVTIDGALRIAGVERSMRFNGSAFRTGSGEWMLTGDRVINVRDFGIAPPRRFFGLLRVRNEVTVHFELAVRPLIDPLGVLTASLQ